MKRGKVLLMMAVVAVLALAGLTTASAHTGPPPGGLETHIDLSQLPTTVAEAQSLGYIVPPPQQCVPGMGRHAVRIGEGGRLLQPILLFGNDGKLVGIEFITRFYYPNLPFDRELSNFVMRANYGIDLDNPATWPVPVPPWEGPMGPHPGMPKFSWHWDLHIYMQDASNACS